MPVTRGFVEGLEIGRAGLATAFLIQGDGTRASYTIADLDADPERFNERLSKLGLLRDAMDRAEPVEIEFEAGDNDQSGQILRLRRLTRDALAPIEETSSVSGTVIGVAITLRHAASNPEPSDQAALALLVGSSVQRFVIDLQMPERGTAQAMVDMARQAQASGSILRVDFSTKARKVIGVSQGDSRGGGGGEGVFFGAYVETIAQLPVTDMMLVSVTTGPPFESSGNMVELVPFEPQQRQLAVLRGSPEYALFEAALRDTLRIEVLAEERGSRDDGDDGERGDETEDIRDDNGEIIIDRDPGPAIFLAHSGVNLDAQPTATRAMIPVSDVSLVRGARLCAPLCSASRPVWIRIDRKALDAGPDAACVEGLPTNDLTPRTLHEIDLPYRAEWIGQGCFNHGVYRFEIKTDADFVVLVDDEELCLHRDAEDQAWFGHACLHGEHEVRVAFANWSCKRQFDIDVYRIR